MDKVPWALKWEAMSYVAGWLSEGPDRGQSLPAGPMGTVTNSFIKGDTGMQAGKPVCAKGRRLETQREGGRRAVNDASLCRTGGYTLFFKEKIMNAISS